MSNPLKHLQGPNILCRGLLLSNVLTFSKHNFCPHGVYEIQLDVYSTIIITDKNLPWWEFVMMGMSL